MITAEQMRVARVIMGWRPSKLAQVAEVTTTARRLEGVGSPIDPDPVVMSKLRRALEPAGVEFSLIRTGTPAFA